jgi:hypothetical protein
MKGMAEEPASLFPFLLFPFQDLSLGSKCKRQIPHLLRDNGIGRLSPNPLRSGSLLTKLLGYFHADHLPTLDSSDEPVSKT